MRTLILRGAALVLLFGPAMTVPAQGAVRPGQIGAEAAAFSAPGLAPARLRPVIVTNTGTTAEDRHDRRMSRIWVASLFAMAAASGMDAATSWGKPEGNSLLASQDGTFGAKGMSIKVGIAAGIVIPQALMCRHKNLKSKFAIGNFAAAGLFSGVAVHNMGIPANR